MKIAKNIRKVVYILFLLTISIIYTACPPFGSPDLEDSNVIYELYGKLYDFRLLGKWTDGISEYIFYDDYTISIDGIKQTCWSSSQDYSDPTYGNLIMEEDPYTVFQYHFSDEDTFGSSFSGAYSSYTRVIEVVPKFVSTWDTTKLSDGSSNSDQIKLPLEENGIYDFTIDWGDGSENIIKAYDDPATIHTYNSPGVYDLQIKGQLVGFKFRYPCDNEKILNIKEWGPLNLGNSGQYFMDASNLKITAIDILDLTGTTSLSEAFYLCTSLTTIPSMNSWDVSNVSDMGGLFQFASSFNQDIGSWNTSNVTNMQWMFGGATDFNQDLSSWDVSNVVNMRLMFHLASSFNQNISNWDVSNVTNMEGMFNGALTFSQDLSTWDVSNVTNMATMFYLSGLNSMNYDKLLNGWASLPSLQDNVVFDGGSAKYSEVSNVSRQKLINDYSWNITDSGQNLNPTVEIPTGLSVSGITTNSIILSWNPSAGAINYQLTRNGVQIYSGDTVMFIDTGLSSGTSYSYAVRATNNDGSSSYSSTVTGITTAVTTLPATPTGLSVSGITTNSLSLSWNPSSGATSYQVTRNGTQVYSGSSLSFLNTGLSSGTSYSYAVRAINNEGSSSYSNSIIGTTVAVSTPPEIPTGLSVTGITTNSLSLSWNPSSGATSYQVTRNGNQVYSGSSLSFLNSGLSSGTSYSYAVRATNNDGSSSYSSTITGTTTPLDNCSISVTSPTSGSVWTPGQSATINWSSEGTIDYVKIEVYENGSARWQIISSTENDGSYIWSDVSSILINGPYQIKVSDVTDNSIYALSAYFNTGDIETIPSTPTGLTVTRTTESSVDLSWDPSVGATSYQVTRNGSPVYLGSSLGFSDNGLSSGTSYTYAIRAINTYGLSSYSVTVIGTTSNYSLNPDFTNLLEELYVNEDSIIINWNPLIEGDQVLVQLNKDGVPYHSFGYSPLVGSFQYDIPRSFDVGDNYQLLIYLNESDYEYSPSFSIKDRIDDYNINYADIDMTVSIEPVDGSYNIKPNETKQFRISVKSNNINNLKGPGEVALSVPNNYGISISGDIFDRKFIRQWAITNFEEFTYSDVQSMIAIQNYASLAPWSAIASLLPWGESEASIILEYLATDAVSFTSGFTYLINNVITPWQTRYYSYGNSPIGIYWSPDSSVLFDRISSAYDLGPITQGFAMQEVETIINLTASTLADNLIFSIYGFFTWWDGSLTSQKVGFQHDIQLSRIDWR